MARLGRYHVLGLLGRGGMGVIYSAYDEQLRRRVAIKQIHRSIDEHALRRSLREAQALARSAHPNIVAVHEVFELGDQPYIVMEFVAGQTLREWLSATRPGWSRIVGALQQAGRGIAAVHAAGMIHRDLTPDNIMVGESGRVYVVDFGLARAVAPSKNLLEFELAAPHPDLVDAADPDLDAFVGTPGYVAPERGLAVDARSDIFSFCVLAFEALHGARPFSGASAEALREQILAGNITAALDEGVPNRISAVLRRGLAADPRARWPSMDAMLDALAGDAPEPAHVGSFAHESARRVRPRQDRLSPQASS